MRKLAIGFVIAGLVVVHPRTAMAQSTAPAQSVIPPIVLQGCAEKVKAARKHIFATQYSLGANATGAQVVGFDLSFVNTTNKVAKIVMIRVGGTDFTKIGTFSPDAVIAWRLAAPEGTCEVKAVRFEDGTEWSEAPAAAPSYSAPAAATGSQPAVAPAEATTSAPAASEPATSAPAPSPSP